MTNLIVPDEEQTERAALDAAHYYVQTVKQWKPHEYQLEFMGIKEMEGKVVVILESIHKADFDNDQRGGGQSVQLYVDAQSHQVIRELAYQ